MGAAGGEDAESQAVLEYSLRQHASEPLDIVWLSVGEPPMDGWNTRGWSTPFSGLRWAIPALCGFEGRAIYLDSDMIAMGDVAELWGQEIPEGKAVLAKGEGRKLRTCVMLMDCQALGAWLPPLKDVKRLADGRHFNDRLGERPDLVGQIAGLWNCVDLKSCAGLDDPALRLIHYSSIAHQPHMRHAIARLKAQGRSHWYDGERFPHWRPELVALFDRLLPEAIAEGYLPESYEVAGWRRPQGLKSYRGVRVKGFSTW